MDPAPCMVTLWHASGMEVPAELLAALSGAKSKTSGVRIRIVCDPFMALAELCRTRAAEHRAGPTSARLVMVYPELLTDAAELCLAADTYAPAVPRWQYGPASNPTLRPIVESDVQRWTSRNTPQITTRPGAIDSAVSARSSRTTPISAAPHLRLAGQGPVSPGPALDNPSEPADGDRLAGDAPAAPAPRSAPLITDEELRMLLGENNDEDRDQR